MSVASWIWVGLFVIGVTLFVGYHRSERFFRCLLFTAFTGVGALGIVLLVGRFVDVGLAFTPLSLGISAILGVPGVVGMLLLNLI